MVHKNVHFSTGDYEAKSSKFADLIMRKGLQQDCPGQESKLEGLSCSTGSTPTGPTSSMGESIAASF